MPVSKKMKVRPLSLYRALQSLYSLQAANHTPRLQVQREHRKADAAGTRAPVKANGLPVKAPKPTSLVRPLRVPEGIGRIA